MLAHDLRFERAVTIAGHLDVDRADIGDHRLGPGAVTRVVPVAALHGVLLIAEMAVHLTLQAGLEHPAGQIAEQPTRAGQLHPLGLGSIHELLGELLIDHTRCFGHWSYSPASHRSPSQTRTQLHRVSDTPDLGVRRCRGRVTGDVYRLLTARADDLG